MKRQRVGVPRRTVKRRRFSRRPLQRALRYTKEPSYFDAEQSSYLSIVAQDDWTGTELTPGGPGSVGALFYPTRGSLINQVEKSKCLVTRLTIRGVIRVAASSGAAGFNPTVVRLILYLDKQANFTAAQGEQVMTGATNATGAPFTFRNLQQLSRFRVLKDKTFKITAPDTGTYNDAAIITAGAKIPFKWSIRFKNPLMFRFTTATLNGNSGDMVTNNFQLIGNSDSTSLQAQIAYTARTYFRDV